VQAARESARRTHCRNNLKQLGLALQKYHDVHKRLPLGGVHNLAAPAISGATPGSSSWGPSWAIFILPMIEQHALHDQYDFTLPRTRDGINATVVATTVPTYICPSDAIGALPWVNTVPHARGNYACSTGPGSTWSVTEFPSLSLRGAFSPTFHWGATFTEVLDGLSNTIFLGEIIAGREPGDVRGAWGGCLLISALALVVPLMGCGQAELPYTDNSQDPVAYARDIKGLIASAVRQAKTSQEPIDHLAPVCWN
jgi:hypothetical protein